MQNRPADIADRIKSMLVYESDHKEYILPDHHRKFMRLNAEKRRIKGDGPILIYSKEDVPKDKTLFPYNVNALLQELPLHIRLQLGTDTFKTDIDRFFGGKCQHPPSKPADKCRLCIKRELFAENIINRNQPIYDTDMFDKDIMFFNYRQTGHNTWSSLLHTWKLCQLDRLNEINIELQAMAPHLKTRTAFTAAYK